MLRACEVCATRRLLLAPAASGITDYRCTKGVVDAGQLTVGSPIARVSLQLWHTPFRYFVAFPADKKEGLEGKRFERLGLFCTL
jgi:hypothetical protein